MDNQSFETRCVHAGVTPDPSTGAIMTPIFQTSTYTQKAPGDHLGFEYSRTQNPTRLALEQSLAALEGGKFAHAFASGCAATTTVLSCLKQGDHVLSVDDLYGGTFRLFTKVLTKFGLDFSFADLSDLSNLEGALRPETKLIWLETPTNPLLKLVDIEKISEVAKKLGIAVCVDNTFASPYFQQPLSLGADLVVHSTSKYISGHSDVIGGAVITSDSTWSEELAFNSNSMGSVPGPMDAFLTLRGIKTLHLRMAQHAIGAEVIVAALRASNEVSHIYYPSLESHPQHQIYKKQMSGPSGVISFELKDPEKVNKVLQNTSLFALAESLGGVESLIEHPASMTHASIPKDVRQKIGLSDGLIRLSVGIENPSDLKSDLISAISS